MATDMTEWCTDRPTLTMLGLYESPRLQTPPEPYNLQGANMFCSLYLM